MDGNPAAGVKIDAIEQDKSANNPEFPIAPYALTGEDGSFQVNSYQDGDGLPSGDWTLTFVWAKVIGFGKTEPDKLGGRYSDPAKSQIKCKVDNGAVDLGTIELTTK